MKIGILGGSFNPIHFGHLNIAQYALEILKLDKIIFIPTGNPPHKKLDVNSTQRFEMTKLAIEDNPNFTISDIEILMQGTGYTINVVKELLKEYKDDKLYYIVGADSLKDMDKWYKPEEFLKLITIVGVQRKTDAEISEVKSNLENKFNADIILLETPLFDISSSEIRQRIKENKKIDYLIPKNVVSYIIENKLYK